MVNTKIKKFFTNLLPEFFGDSQISTKSESAVFLLLFEKRVIAILKYKDEKWIFKYSEEFMKEPSIDPIISFPDINKKYEFSQLPPFFAARIPKINQPFQRKKILKHKGSSTDIVSLLEIFGAKSINNSFELIKDSKGC